MFDTAVKVEFGGGHSVGRGLARKMIVVVRPTAALLWREKPSLTRRVVLDFRRFKREAD